MPPRKHRHWVRNTQPIKIAPGRAVVMLIGGPRDGWAYYADDLDRLVVAAQHSGRTFPYRPDDEMMVHPGTTDTVVGVWKWYRAG